MKKFYVLATMFVAMFVYTQVAQAQNNPVNINLSMTVDKYIETTESPLSWHVGTTEHIANAEVLNGGLKEWNLAYANCPFSVTITGDNAANQGVPRFARKEEGAHGVGYDVLPTFYKIHFTTNHHDRKSFHDAWKQSALQFPHTKSFDEAPHNGQILMDLQTWVNTADNGEGVPQRETLINPNFTNSQSADAGVYECTMVVTLTAL